MRFVGLKSIIQQLESCGYECEGGKLEYNTAFQQLVALANHEVEDVAIAANNGASIPQPTPVPGKVNVADVVIDDIHQRVAVGLEKYGTKLQTFNGRDPRWDLYQELIDAVMYLRQDLLEREARPTPGDDREYLRLLAEQLEAAPRQGKYEDMPEGARYVIISDTALIQITAFLRQIAGGV